MREITLRAYGKINLSLDVIGKRQDGYHNVEMVMQQIGLYDEVTVRLGEGSCYIDEETHTEKEVRLREVGVTGRIVITSTDGQLPCDERNLAYKAAAMMREIFRPDEERISIHLVKRIPVSAGLAGGSADAAAVIHALKILWKLPVSLSELMERAASLGADIPFCLMGQAAVMRDQDGELLYKNVSTCALAEGIGEKLTPVPPLDSLVLLAKPPIGVSTAEVFQKLDFSAIAEHPETRELIFGLREKNLFKIRRSMVNVLETVTLKRYVQVQETKDLLLSLKATPKVLMSGSGPTVFALFENRKKAQSAYEKVKKTYKETYLVRTLIET